MKLLRLNYSLSRSISTYRFVTSLHNQVGFLQLMKRKNFTQFYK